MGNRLAPAPQPLPDDRIYDILLRLPPDDPAGIIRASAVCKAWRRIISDPGFHGQYRAFHPSAPVLGFLHRPRNNELRLPRFVSTTSFRPAAADHRQHPLDCRHGRAVFYDYSTIGGYVVWDPVTGELHKLPREPGGEFLPHAAVVCAADGGCDHRGCSGGPFIVAFVGLEHISEIFDDDDDDDNEDETTDEDDDDENAPFIDDDDNEDETTDNDDDDENAPFIDDDDDDDNEDETTDEDHDEENAPFIDAHACFYASDTGELAGDIHVHLGHGRYHVNDRPAALVGDSLYYLCMPQGILRYRYGLLRRLGGVLGMIRAGIKEKDVLSMMELPRWKHLGIGKNTNVVIMTAEGGGLGLACLCPKTRTMLYLLARETTENTVGEDRWVQRKVIDLKKLIPVGKNPERQPCLRGIAQEANVIFVRTEDGVFSIDLGSSLQVRKVCEVGLVDDWMHPFVSFYTDSLLLKLASRKYSAPPGNQ